MQAVSTNDRLDGLCSEVKTATSADNFRRGLTSAGIYLALGDIALMKREPASRCQHHRSGRRRWLASAVRRQLTFGTKMK
jgi:hypothetical protein